MPNPVCVPCQRFYRAHDNSFSMIEGMPTDGVREAKPGKEGDADWQDYKLWLGDLYKCPGCGHEIVVGFGKGPVSEHYLPDWKRAVESYQPRFRVNDC